MEIITIIGRIMELTSEELLSIKQAKDRETYIYHEGRLSILKEIAELFKVE